MAGQLDRPGQALGAEHGSLRLAKAKRTRRQVQGVLLRASRDGERRGVSAASASGCRIALRARRMRWLFAAGRVSAGVRETEHERRDQGASE